MKKTKRFLALLLAILMVISGVLSGVPGGGVARAEEWDVGSEIIGDGEEVAVVALGQEMAENTPEEEMPEEPSHSKEVTVAKSNPFEQEMAEENTASNEENAGIQEIFNEKSAEDPPFGASEESEDEEEETLTNTVFGEYDPSSIAEASFDENVPFEQGVKDFTDEVGADFAGKNFIVEEDSDSAEGESEEDFRGYNFETLAGGDTWIYFDRSNATSHNNGNWRDTGAIYIHAWGGDGEISWTAMTWMPGSTTKCYYNIGNRTGFQLSSTNSGNHTGNDTTEDAPSVGNGYIFKLSGANGDYNHSDNENRTTKYDLVKSGDQNPADPNGGSSSSGNLPDDIDISASDQQISPDEDASNALVLYYDASLSVIVRDTGDNAWKNTIPYRNPLSNSNEYITTTTRNGPIFLVIAASPGTGGAVGQYYEGTRMTTKTDITDLGGSRAKADPANGTWLYKFVVDRTKFTDSTKIAFTTQRYENNAWSTATSTGDPARTVVVKLPEGELAAGTKTITHNCFYGDSSDSYTYDTTKARGGYWDKVSGPRDPERRANATKDVGSGPSFYNYIVDDADMTSADVIDSVVNIGEMSTIPGSTPVPKSNYTPNGGANGGKDGQKVLPVTLYDYYSDYELNGKNRDTYPVDTAEKFRAFYPFLGLNRALSTAYKEKNEDVALYTGHFQRSTNGDWGLWYKLAQQGNWLYDFYSDCNTTNGSESNPKYWKFMAHNNSSVKYDGDIEYYNAVIRDLVGSSTKKGVDNHTEEGLYTYHNSMLLPYFDEKFLNGQNVLGTKLGKVYKEVEFPFSIERRKNSDNSNKYVDFYVFAARNDLMSSSGSYPTKRELGNSTDGWAVWNGDAALLKRKTGTTDYFIQNYANTSIANNDLTNGNHSVENVDSNMNKLNSMGFFPFNEDIQTKSNSDQAAASKYNYGYGMKFETTFKLRKDGKVLAKDANGNYLSDVEENLTDCIFRFSGDDDVWIFIDGKLILDLGGDHSAAEGTINFVSKDISIGRTWSYTKTGNEYNKYDLWGGRNYTQLDGKVKNGPNNNGDKTNNGSSNDTIVTFTLDGLEGKDATTHSNSEYEVHTLTMYYMERGMWESNMTIEFNMEAYPADSPKVNLEINKEWAPSSSGATEANFIVLRKHNDGKRSRVSLSGGQNVFTIKAPATSMTIEKLEAFEEPDDPESSKGRFVYEVYEIDAGFDNTKLYTDSANVGHYHFVGSVGGGTWSSSNPTNNNTTVVNRADATLSNDADTFSIDLDGSGAGEATRYYTLTGTASLGSTDGLPYFNTDENGKNHDGKYVYNATNANAEVTVEKSWKYWNGLAYENLNTNYWKPVKVKLQRKVRASDDSWADVPTTAIKDGGANTAVLGPDIWSKTFIIKEPYDSSGNLYEYRVVELGKSGNTQDVVLDEKATSYYFADENSDNTPEYHAADEFKVYYDRIPAGGTIAPSPTPAATAGSTSVSGAVDDGVMEEATANLRAGTPGSYYLARDFTISEAITLTGNLTIDLKGHDLTLTSSTAHFVINGGATLNICDSSTGHRGRIFISNTLASVTNGTVNFNGGIIDGTGSSSRVFDISGGSSYLYMTGVATIRNAQGGAVNLGYGARFNMTGGYIQDCLMSSGSGGAVYVAAGATLTLDGSVNSIVFNGNTATTSGGAIYNAGTLNMKGTIDIGEGIGGATNKDTVCLASNSWNDASTTLDGNTTANWIQINGPLTIAGDGYIDIETSDSNYGNTVAKNASPDTGDDHISAETFCTYGKYFINSGDSLTVSGGYDYDAEGNLDLVITPQTGVSYFGTEDYYPKDWPTSATTTGTEYTYVNANGDSLKVTATSDENQRVYQSEGFLIYAKGKTSADTADWKVTITNQDEPVAAYAVHTYFTESGTAVAYLDANEEFPSIEPVLYQGTILDGTARTINEYSNYNQETTGWTRYTPSSAWASPLEYAVNESSYYGWRTDLIEDLPARNASNVRYEYRFISGGTIPNYDQGVKSKWYATGAGTNPGEPIRRSLSGIFSSSSSYTSNVYRTDITEVPYTQIQKVWKTYDDSPDGSGDKTAYFKLIATKVSDSSTSVVATLTVTYTASDNSLTISPASITDTDSPFKGMTFSAAVESAGTWSIGGHNISTGYTFAFAEVDSASSETVTVDASHTSGLMTLNGVHYKVDYDGSATPPTFTNRALVSATVTKAWKRGDIDLAPTPAGSVYFVLKRTTAATPADSSWTPALKADGTAVGEITVSPTSWTATVTDLPYDNGTTPYKYCFFELTGTGGSPIADEGTYNIQYTVDYGTLGANGYGTAASGNWTQTVTNRKKLIRVKLMKSWQRWNDSASTPAYEEVSNPASNTNLPASINYKLQSKTPSGSWTDVTRSANYPNNGDLAITANNTLAQANYVTGVTFTHLDKYDDSGNLLSYRFVELDSSGNVLATTTSIGGYFATTNDPAPATVNASDSSLYEQTLVNQDTPISVTATKTFSDGATTGDVRLRLQRKVGSGSYETAFASTSVRTISFTGETSKTAVWSNLSRHDSSGNLYTYVVEEIDGSSQRVQEGTSNPTITVDGKKYLVSYSVESGTATADSENISNLAVINTPANVGFNLFKVEEGTFQCDTNGTIVNNKSGSALSGAQFTLTRKDASTDAVTDIWTLTTQSDGKATHVTGISRTGGPTSPVTDISEGLNDGKYTLVETVAPLGYAMHSGSISFTISGGVLTLDTDTTAVRTAAGLVANTPYSKTEDGFTTYYFVFENSTGTELPGTGAAFGLSRMGFASLGTVLLSAFVALYMYKKRQRYYEAEDDNT